MTPSHLHLSAEVEAENEAYLKAKPLLAITQPRFEAPRRVRGSIAWWQDALARNRYTALSTEAVAPTRGSDAKAGRSWTPAAGN